MGLAFVKVLGPVDMVAEPDVIAVGQTDLGKGRTDFNPDRQRRVEPDVAAAEWESRILACVRSPDYRPLKPRGIARRLKVADDEAMEVKRAVKRLVRRGKLVYEANHLVRAAAGL